MNPDIVERAWEVQWMSGLHAGADAAAMTPFVMTVATLPPTIEVALVMEGGDGSIRAWLVSRAPSEEEAQLCRDLLVGVAPWIGLSESPVDVPIPNGVVMRAKLDERDPRGEALRDDSVFAQVARSSNSRWLLVVRPGPESTAGNGYHVGLALVGEGPELHTAGPLLEHDGAVTKASLAISLEPAGLVNEQRTSLLDLASFGGELRLSSVGRLLSIPLRSGDWPNVPRRPSDPKEILAAVHEAVPPHVYVLGGSGTGKTQLLGHFIHEAVARSVVPVVIDTSGDLPDLATTILASSAVDAQIVDFGAEPPPLWNLVQPDRGISLEEHAQMVSQAIASLWNNPEWTGAVWQEAFGWGVDLIALDEEGPWPLTRLPELYQKESAFRDMLLDRADPRLQRVYDRSIVPMLFQRDPGNTVPWIVSKVHPFVADPTVRRIIDTKQGTLDLRQVTEGRPLVVRFPQTAITPTGVRILARILVGRLWLLFKRFGVTQNVWLVFDEWQNWATSAVAEILAEGRKIGIRAILANQNAAQLPSELWESAMANTGVLITFQVGPKDAALIEPRFPTIPAGPLARLPKHWVAVTTGDRDFIAPAPAPLDFDTALQTKLDLSDIAAGNQVH